VTKQRAQSGANGEIVSPRSLPAAGKSVVLLESAPTTTPIANRSSDWLFVVWYAIFWFTVMCVAADADPGVGDAGARRERRARWMTATDPRPPHSPSPISRRWTDLHNFRASVSGTTVQDLEKLVMEDGVSLVVPPHWLSYYYFRWARTADPLLYQNPVWWQCIEWVNLLCLMPFSVVAGWAFYKGYNWIRTPAIIVSSFTFYSLIMCIGTTL
jgi:hypothetical protein